MTNKKIISLVLIIVFIVSCMPVYSESSIEISPKDGEYIGQLPEYFKVDCPDSDFVSVELDGKYLGTVDKDGHIKVPDSLDYGTHKLKATAVFEDNTALSKETSFVYYQKEGFFKSIQDFNTLPDITSDDTSATYSNISGNYNMYYYTNQSCVSRIPGSKSNGSDGDYALYVEKKVSNGSGEARLLLDKESKTDVYATNGKIVTKFDLMLTDPSQVFRFFYYPIWYDGFILVSGGKIAGTNVTFPANKWVTFNMIYDMTEGDGTLASGTWTVEVTIDGVTTVAVDSVKAVYNQFQSGTRILFSMYSGASTKEKPIAMAIDNYSLTVEYYGIKKCAYIKSGKENEITSKVPCDAEKIKAYLNEEITSVSKSDVSLVTDSGVNVPVADVVYNADEKYIEITPESNLPGNTGISVKLSPDLTFKGGTKLGKSHTFRFETSYETLDLDVSFERSGSSLYSAKQIKLGDVISADLMVKNLSGSVKDATYILSVRDNQKLAALSSETISLQPDEVKSFTITLPQLKKDGDYTVYLINMESLSTGLYIEDYIELK